MDCASGGPAALVIVTLPLMPVVPSVQQYIPRPRVVAGDQAHSLQYGYICHPANIDDCPVAINGGERGLMKARYQRRRLASGGDITPTEVGNRGYPGNFGDSIGVADLTGECRFRRSRLRRWAMADGLTMTTNRGDPTGIGVRTVEQLNTCIGKQVAELAVKFAHALYLSRAILAQPEDLVACIAVDARAMVVQQAGLSVALITIDEHSVDTVDAGA